MVLIVLLVIVATGSGIYVCYDVYLRHRANTDRLAFSFSEQEVRDNRERVLREQREKEERERQEAASKAAAENREINDFLTRLRPALEREARREAEYQHTASRVELVNKTEDFTVEEQTASWVIGHASYDVYMRGSIIGSNRFCVTVRVRCKIIRGGELQHEILGRAVVSDVRLN